MSKRGSVPPEWRTVIWAACEKQCAYCDTPLEKDGSWHMEHVIPIARHGHHAIDNLVVACQPCNASVKDRLFRSVFEKRDAIRVKRGLPPLPASPQRFQHLNNRHREEERTMIREGFAGQLHGTDPAISKASMDDRPARTSLYLSLHSRAPEGDVATLLAEAKRRKVSVGILLTEIIAAAVEEWRQREVELDRALELVI